MMDRSYLGWFRDRLEDAKKQNLDDGHREADSIVVEVLEYLDEQGIGDGVLKEIAEAYEGVPKYFG